MVPNRRRRLRPIITECAASGRLQVVASPKTMTTTSPAPTLHRSALRQRAPIQPDQLSAHIRRLARTFLVPRSFRPLRRVPRAMLTTCRRCAIAAYPRTQFDIDISLSAWSPNRHKNPSHYATVWYPRGRFERRRNVFEVNPLTPTAQKAWRHRRNRRRRSKKIARPNSNKGKTIESLPITRLPGGYPASRRAQIPSCHGLRQPRARPYSQQNFRPPSCPQRRRYDNCPSHHHRTKKFVNVKEHTTPSASARNTPSSLTSPVLMASNETCFVATIAFGVRQQFRTPLFLAVSGDCTAEPAISFPTSFFGGFLQAQFQEAPP